MNFYSKLNSVASAPVLSWLPWSNHDPVYEVDATSKSVLLRLARSQYYNSSPVRKLVKDLVLLTGNVTPIVSSGDNEWDALAVKEFNKWANNPHAFDRSGKLTFAMSQSYLDRVSIIDGDAFAVFSRAENGMLQLCFYPGAQCVGADQGIKEDDYGRAEYYSFKNYRTGDLVNVPASAVVHYMQEKDPSGKRGLSELVSALGDAAGITDLNDAHKKIIRLATYFGLVETVQHGASAQTNLFQDMANAQAVKIAEETGETPQEVLARDPSFKLHGASGVQLPAGHKLEVISDKRPSAEVRSFVGDLTSSLAEGSGQAAEMIYSPKDLGSASVRMILEKNRDWESERMGIKKLYASAVWSLWVSDAIKNGVLPYCKGDPFSVKWQRGRDKSIDVARNTRSMLDLVFSGVSSYQDLAVQLGSGDWRSVLNDNIEFLDYAKKLAESKGFAMSDLLPGGFGYTQPWDPNKPLEVEQYIHENENTNEGN